MTHTMTHLRAAAATLQLHWPAGQSPQAVATAVCLVAAASTFIRLDKSLILSGQPAASCAAHTYMWVGVWGRTPSPPLNGDGSPAA